MRNSKSHYLLNVAEVAEMLSVSTKTVRRMIDTGALRHHRIGRAIRVSSEDLTNYVNSTRQ